MGNKIHVDTFLIPHHSFCLRLCSVSLVFLLRALTEVQSNYWNIWMTGPSLYPLANGAWLLQKGMGRTLVPLTDISHQRSMTSPTLKLYVSLRRTLVKIWWHMMTFIPKSNNQAKDMNHNQEAERRQRFWWEQELDLGWNLEWNLVLWIFPSSIEGLTRELVYHKQCSWCDRLSHYRSLPGSTHDISIPKMLNSNC